jgi:hypothetical protein
VVFLGFHQHGIGIARKRQYDENIAAFGGPAFVDT